MRIKKAEMTIIQNTQERNPLVFQEAKIEVGILQTGDYSLKGFENQVAIERKSLSDLLLSFEIECERFIREIQDLKAYAYRALVIESSLSALNAENWRSKITPRTVIRRLLRLSSNGLHVVWAENRKMAARAIESLLKLFLKELGEKGV